MENKTPKFTPVKDLTYTQAVSELDAILRNMQSDQCDIDNLTALTRRATELLCERGQGLRAILADLEK